MSPMSRELGLVLHWCQVGHGHKAFQRSLFVSRLLFLRGAGLGDSLGAVEPRASVMAAGRGWQSAAQRADRDAPADA